MAADRISLRRTGRRDGPAIEAILLDTFESTWRPNISVAAATAFIEQRRTAAYVSQRWADFWVAEQAGRIVGFVHWQDDFVHALHVLSSRARLGVGSRLMDLAEDAMAEAGHAAARLETDTFNTRSRVFYEGRGYREAGRYPDEEWNSDLTTILLVKPLR